MPDWSDLLRRVLALTDQLLDWAAVKQQLVVAFDQVVATLQRLSLHDALLVWGVLLLTLLCILTVRLKRSFDRHGTKQLRVTTDLVRAAEAKAALQDERSERQLRAYVDVSAVSFQRFAAGQEIIVQIELRNHGLTPALDLLTQVNLVICPFPATDLPDLDPSQLNGLPATLAARESRTVVQRVDMQTSPGVAERLLTGELGFYVVGRLSYADVFGREQITSFSMVASGERMRGRQPFVRCEAGNRIS